MKNYQQLLMKILCEGEDRSDRTGVGTRGLFGETLEWNMADGFPLMTTKAMSLKPIVAELLWFLSGSQDVKSLNNLGAKIWDANAYADYWKPKAKFAGDVGRIYGVQWRAFRGLDTEMHPVCVDQIERLINTLRGNPVDRRMIVTAWNPAELDQVCLPPCHMFFQCYVRKPFTKNNTLDLHMYQRSCDTFLGVPYNIASYALLLHILAEEANMLPGKLKITFGDVHIYQTHMEQVDLQMRRCPKSLPKLIMKPRHHYSAHTVEDFTLEGYDPDPAIKAEMAV